MILSTATYQGTWNSSMKGQGHCSGAAQFSRLQAHPKFKADLARAKEEVKRLLSSKTQ